MSRRAAELFAADADGTTSTAKWLAGQSGEGVGKARRDLEMAKKLASQPELEEALRSGVVSPTQASVLLPAVEADPDASRQLINAAQEDSLNELRQQCQRVVAAKRSEEEAELRDARLRERRYLHIGTTEDGAVSIRGELPPVEGAVVKNTLEAMKRKIFDEARRAGRRESHEAYMADALIAMCVSDGAAAPRNGGPRAEIVLHVSAEALRRGELQAGELCEIEGVGPVALSTVEYLFGDAWAKLIIEKGVDIATVTHFGRCIPAHLETALSKRDRVCAVPGCGISYGLERDHIIPVAEGGRTELNNLVKICKRHHYLKTHHFWRLIGAPGTWQWINIRENQEIVADGDLFDVVRPGEPVAGLGRPVLRPREPVFSDEDSSDANATAASMFQQQSLAYSAAGAVVVVRLSSALLAQLQATTGREDHSWRQPAATDTDTPSRLAAANSSSRCAAADTSRPTAGVYVHGGGIPQYPRAIQSSRCGASSRIDVSSPCPVRTRVSGGSWSSRDLIDSMIVGKSDQDRPVAPGPPRKSVSPEKTVADSASYKQHPPGVCPGVCRTLSGVRPTRNTSPSCSSPSGLDSGYTSRHRGRSAACRRTGARSADASATAALMWSLWPWVPTIATVRRSPTAAAIASWSWAASTMMTSDASPTIQTLFSTSNFSPSMAKMPEVLTRSITATSSRPGGGDQEAHAHAGSRTADIHITTTDRSTSPRSMR